MNRWAWLMISIFALQVVLSKEKSTGDVFATKIMKKAHILQQPDVRITLFSLIHIKHLSPVVTPLYMMVL